jgi:hypothetical protein
VRKRHAGRRGGIVGGVEESFASNTSGARAPAAVSASTVATSAATGVAMKMSCAPIASSSAAVTRRRDGSATPGRYLRLTRALDIVDALTASRVQSVTSRSARRARWHAIAVPHAPPPRTAIAVAKGSAPAASPGAASSPDRQPIERPNCHRRATARRSA